MANRATIRVGIIGAGSAGRRHAIAYRQLPYVQVTVIVDPARERGVEVASAVGGKHFIDPTSEFGGRKGRPVKWDKLWSQRVAGQ